MITLPSSGSYPQARLYADSADPQLAYLDILKPAPVSGSHVLRWLLLPEKRAFLSGEIRYGPTTQDYTDTFLGKARLLPMPWPSCPVHVWNLRGLLAEGKTSGMGMSNAVLSALTPVDAVGLPLIVAAELTCKAQLVGLSVHGGGDVEAVKAAVGKLPLGDWDTTIGDALVMALNALVERGGLTIHIEGNHAHQAEITQLVLLEWAYRLLTSGSSGGLALPASHYSHLAASDSLDLNIHWRPTDFITFRAIRVIRYADIPV